MRNSRVRTVTLWSTTAVLGLAVAAGAGTIALADTPHQRLVSVSAEKSAPAGKADKAAKKAKKKGPLAAVRGLHGEFVVRRGAEFVTVLTQKGTVSAADAASLTVKSADGFSRTYALDAKTKVKHRKSDSTAAPKAGDTVIVVAEGKGDAVRAKRVVIRPAK